MLACHSWFTLYYSLLLGTDSPKSKKKTPVSFVNSASAYLPLVSFSLISHVFVCKRLNGVVSEPQCVCVRGYSVWFCMRVVEMKGSDLFIAVLVITSIMCV